LKILKKIIFPLISLFLVQRSFDLMIHLTELNTNKFSLTETLVLAFLLNIYITGVFAFVGFAYPTNRILPSTYYKISKPNLLAKVYMLLGVKYFRVSLLIFFWGKKRNRKKYFNGTRKGLNNFVYQTKQSEFGHFGAFVTLLITSLILLFQGSYYLFCAVTALNTLGNFYPIMLQRIHRMRIERLSPKTII